MRKRHLISTLVVGSMVCAASLAIAQPKFPSQPIKLVVPYPAGGGSDIFARNVAQSMSNTLGQPVVVENKPGASTMIAAQYVAKLAPADGYTVLWGDMTTYAVAPTLFSKQLQYDVRKDLMPVTMAGTLDLMLLVNPKVLPVTNVKELVLAASKAPDGLNYSNPSIGTSHHLATELFARESGAKLVGINYKGGGPAVQDLLGGQTSLMFLDRATAKPHVEAGSLRAIAVAGSKRVSAFPNVPTLDESGLKGYRVEAWQGLTVRAGTPQAAIATLANAFSKATDSPEVREKLSAAGIDVKTSTPQEFAAFIQAETSRWADLIRTNSIKAE